MKIKKLALGFGFFFASYLVARIIDQKLGVTDKLAALIPGSKA